MLRATIEERIELTTNKAVHRKSANGSNLIGAVTRGLGDGNRSSKASCSLHTMRPPQPVALNFANAMFSDISLLPLSSCYVRCKPRFPVWSC